MKMQSEIKNMVCLLVAVFCIVGTSLFAEELPVVCPEKVGMSSEKLKKVGEIVEAIIAEKKIAGASVIIASQGKVCFFETYGKMDKYSTACFP